MSSEDDYWDEEPETVDFEGIVTPAEWFSEEPSPQLVEQHLSRGSARRASGSCRVRSCWRS
jgi:hypothetical protein